MRLKRPAILDCTSDTAVCRTILSTKQLLSYLGPGFFVTVGFIDPGNWATNIAAGSGFGYHLLWVVTLSTIILILWQHMSAHLGIVTGKCLAEAVYEHMHPIPRYIFGITAMLAGIATAVAEILGISIGLYILFHIPVKIAALIGSGLVTTTILLQKYKQLEKFIVGLVSIIGLCYLIELYLVKPDWAMAMKGMVVPHLNSSSIVIAMGVLGAVVMPHNMYLHSEVIQNRQWYGKSPDETRRLLRYEFLDTLLAMFAGFAINAAMVIVAASVFFSHNISVSDLVKTSETLRPIAGQFAGFIFGVALLAAGYSSSVTAGIAGGTIFSGYIGKETDIEGKWFRIGMLLTIIPATLVVLLVKNTFQALILSQVCLSVQLPLTMLPLYLLTTNRKVMGEFANRILENILMILTGILIIGLNIMLIYQIFGGRF